MSSLAKRRRVKRPTLLVKRSQLPKKNGFNKRSYKPLYEKLKANNNALAKALSKEKQESQYLFSQNVALTSDVQELTTACNRRDDIISGVMKDAKETLQLLLNMSSHVTNTIALCQQVSTTTRFTPRKSTANNRRDSTRRLSGKSPARGVVQPMVSGHTITKPTINLSRLNIQREYRVQNPPNLSDIDEVITPQASPTAAESTTPVRIPIASSLNYGTRHLDHLPVRLQEPMRITDDHDRRSSIRSNRNSNRHSGRRSRVSSEASTDVLISRRSAMSELQMGESLRSPRVALHDVSRLLHNSQTVNIRTFLENSSDMEVTQAQQPSYQPMETSRELATTPIPDETIPETSDDPESEPNESSTNREIPKTVKSVNNGHATSPTDEDDPLEGPSWLLNVEESPSFAETNDEVSTGIDDSSPEPRADNSAINDESSSSGEDDNNVNEENSIVRDPRSVSFVSLRGRNKRSTTETRNETNVDCSSRWPAEPRNFYRNFNNNVDDADDDEDDDDDDDNNREEEPTVTTNLCRFVTRKRGSVRDDDDDDYTLLWKRKGPPKNYNFDLNDLELPVLESPIVAVEEFQRPLEPEPTTNIQRITQTFGNYGPACPTVDDDDENIFDHTGLALPIIVENPISERPSTLVEPEEPTDDEDTVPRKRKRNYKKKIVHDSPDESDWAPTPKKKIGRTKRKIGRPKDPSSAKVVLQKLNDTLTKIQTPSSEARRSQETEHGRENSSCSMQHEASTDSEASNASSNTIMASGRPRRQKAPKNLQEPGLGKKMRRN